MVASTYFIVSVVVRGKTAFVIHKQKIIVIYYGKRVLTTFDIRPLFKNIDWKSDYLQLFL